MRFWKIPVTWKMFGTIEVAADTLTNAMRIARDENGEIPLPEESFYVDGSWQLSSDKENEVALYQKGENDNEK